jgi:nitroimidazol reductase NimA-like FMN-containing flavoprotein (pyridoxamine 5'-phosphate oxidase superfamily)
MTELTPEQCWEVLESGTIAHIAVVADGEPYVTPLSYVVRDGEFLFRTAPGRRTSAMQGHPRVCVEVSRLKDDGGWESVVFWGEARFIDDPNRHADVVAALLAKYHTESALGFSSPSVFPQERFVIAITPEDLSGRASGGGLSSTTRPGRL